MYSICALFQFFSLKVVERINTGRFDSNSVHFEIFRTFSISMKVVARVDDLIAILHLFNFSDNHLINVVERIDKARFDSSLRLSNFSR